MMSLHKLTAGDGYEYLTKQVAAQDNTELGKDSLEAYYSAKGEAPGRWLGSGLVAFDDITRGDVVTSEQMKALWGEGRHPNATAIEAAMAAEGHGPGVALAANVSAPLVLAILLGVFGFGQGLVMAPLFATVLSMLPRTQASAGAGMLATVQQAGNATGVALVGALYFALADAHPHRDALLASLAAIGTTLVASIAGLAVLRLRGR